MMMLSALNEQAQRTETPEPYRKQLAMVAEIINASHRKCARYYCTCVLSV